MRVVVRALLGAGLVAMGINHFRPGPARAMAAMIPPSMRRPVPPAALVAFTGLCELAGGVGLQVPVTRRAAGVCLAAFFVAVFPANAYAAQHPDRFGRAAFPFWPRLAAQAGLIAAALWSTRRG